MSTLALIPKSSGLAKTSAGVRHLNRRIEHAGQMFNERIARAEADYRAAIERALAETAQASETEGRDDAGVTSEVTLVSPLAG